MIRIPELDLKKIAFFPIMAYLQLYLKEFMVHKTCKYEDFLGNAGKMPKRIFT
jgi:hypothetical protein